MGCCANCFGDRELRINIIPARTSGRGTCAYCGSHNVALVDPTQLATYFSLLIAIYEPDPNGRVLVEWLKDNWNMFDHPNMTIPAASNLLAHILSDGAIVHQTFSPSNKYRSDALDRWEKLRDELMYRNRYFPDSQINFDRLRELLSNLPAIDVPTRWYRARIQSTDAAFLLKDMREPPNRTASHGRANPPGIPYLYLGSTANTAISEIRPHTGELASVATFDLPNDLKYVDLRDPRKLVSPFFELEDEDKIGFMSVDLLFLERLGQELTRPVLPQGAAVDYVPSQYLCEFIKKSGYDGVIYRSSVSDGMNLALFDPAKATGLMVSKYRVQRVSADIAEIP